MVKLEKWWKERVRGVGGKHLRRAGETITVQIVMEPGLMCPELNPDPDRIGTGAGGF